MKNVVTIGGGTGSFRTLMGIKNIPDISISAIVSMADDGGSSGKLRKDWGVLPGGDIRQCLAALGDQKTYDFLKQKIENGEFAGHMQGNIYLAKLEKEKGSFEKGLAYAIKDLRVKGAVIPVTEDNAELEILFKDGKIIKGENEISNTNFMIKDVEKIYYKNEVRINKRAIEAILKADYIIICPGYFFSSVSPNFIVSGFKEAMAKSKAKIIAVENLNNPEPKEYLRTLETFLGKKIDHLIRGEKNLISSEKIIIDPADAVRRSVIRHDSLKLAKIIEKIIEK